MKEAEAKFIIGCAIAAVFIFCAGFFWSDIDFYRGVSLVAGFIGFITGLFSICNYAFNHGTTWAQERILIPNALSNFFHANLTIGRTKPIEIEDLHNEIKKFNEKKLLVEEAFTDLFKAKKS